MFAFKLVRTKNQVEERERNKRFGKERGGGIIIFTQRVTKSKAKRS